MPTALIGWITPYIAQGLFALTGSTAFVVAATAAVAGAVVYGGLALASYLASSLLNPAQQQPNAPKPEDGKYNLKQSVPPLVYALGRVKKAGDYAFLEETGGTAYHITVIAAHKINGFVSHWLHDEEVGTDGSGFVVYPGHFGPSYVQIQTREGGSSSTAYSEIVSTFPSVWTDDHRGDGLASVMMSVASVAAEDIQATFPSGMPQHQAIIEGHAEIFDPRAETYGYTTNFALFRLWHLTNPVGGKLTLSDMHLPDWINAANVCDQNVTNRAGGSEKRYHGGMWFRANNSPVDIGRIMDQAAELVIYERADGKIGVHAGEYVAPDVRLTANDIVSLSYDANKRRGTNVLAVRGRYTDPDKGYNTTDAAIYGEPYPSDDERTKTVENSAVQKHNHIARLQKLAYIRANAPRAKVVAHFEAARNVPYRRFVKVHLPPKMTEAVVEITGRPTLSLRSLTYSFEGIVVPPDLYDFVAATEEGVPGANVIPVVRDAIPLPADFLVAIQTESVGGGSTAAYAAATFTFQNATFYYEMEWEPTAGGAKQSVQGNAGEISIRSNYLADGVQYKFRARTWAVGARSDWSSYQTLTATADPVAPGVVTGVSATGGTGQITFNWTAPNAPNYVGSRLYWNTTNTIVGATLGGTEYGAPSSGDSRIITGVSVGTRYGFIVAINGSGIEASSVATGAVTVT